MRRAPHAAVVVVVLLACMSASRAARADEPTETPTPGPTDTPTATITPTPTRTGSATPTAPEGCAYFVAPASAAVSTVALSTTEDPPAWHWCVTDMGEAHLAVMSAAAADGLPAIAANVLLRWDTPPQPATYTVSAAWLRLQVDGRDDTDSKALGADWFSGSCESTAHSNDVLSDALSTAGACDEQCFLVNVEPGAPTDFALDAPETLETSGPVGLRLALPFDDSTGMNRLSIANGTADNQDPVLVVLACVTSPVPTPTPDCEVQVLDALGGGADLHAGGLSMGALEVDACVAGSTREARVSVSEGPTYAASLPLLSWETAGLPSNRVIADAALRLHVTGVDHDDTGHRLIADWYVPQPTCGAGDLPAATPTPIPALSVEGCGAACSLSDLTTGDHDFPLDAPEARIDRTGRSGLRLQVDGTPENGTDALRFTDAEPAPQLAVHLCVPTPSAGCQVLAVPTPDTIAELVGSDVEFLNCFDAGDTVELSLDDETVVYRDLLIDWNTTPYVPGYNEGGQMTIPDGEIARAWVRVHVREAWNADGLSLVADWRDWTCSEDDHTDSNSADALTTAGACGGNCELGQMALVAGHDVDLPLDDPDAKIRFGHTRLRLQVSGTPASGRNGIRVSDGSDGHAPPQLFVEICPPTAPTPAPGCHYDSYEPAGGVTLLGEGPGPTPGATPSASYTLCDDNPVARLAGHGEFPFNQHWIVAKALLRWPTRLPADAHIEGVTLRTGILPVVIEAEAASLTADWVDWISCSAEETPLSDAFSAADARDALSADGACGTQCLLSHLPPGRIVELPLDDAADHLSRDGGDTVLRFSVDVGESRPDDMLAIADVQSGWEPPRLIVHWCEPTPTVTPTSGASATPTNTPTDTPLRHRLTPLPHTKQHPDEYADGDAHRHTHGDADEYPNGDTDPHADKHPDSDADGHSNSNPHRYTSPTCYIDADVYTDRHANEYPHEHSHPDRARPRRLRRRPCRLIHRR